VTDSATETLSTVTGPINYTLFAFNADGASVTRMRTLPFTPAVNPASAFVVQNTDTVAVNVFLVNAEDQGGTFVTTLAPNTPPLVVPIPSCQIKGIISIDPQMVRNHNTTFNTNFDPTAVSTARTEAGGWIRYTPPWPPYATGLATALAIGIYNV